MFLTQLREQIRAALEARGALQTELEQIATAAAGEARALTDAETARSAELRAQLDQADADLAELRQRLDDLEAREARQRDADDLARRLEPHAIERPAAPAVVRDEPRTYTRDAERRGVSFLRDLIHRHDDVAADDRIRRHQREAEVDGVEFRDVGTGAFAGLVVPQYLTDLVAPVRRAGRPVADIATRHDLPPSGMTVNISRITTGAATAVQASENAAVQETDIDDTLLTVDVRTIAGQQDVSRQAIDRGTGVDEIVIADLVRAYNTTLDDQIINGAGTSGTHRGIRNVSGIVAVTYTDADPTVGELWPKLADLIQQIQAGVFGGISHFVMAPRRWWWMVSSVGTSFPFLMGGGNRATVQPGNAGSSAYGDNSGREILGVPVVLDGNVPLTVSTNQDVILGVSADELHLWEDPSAPLFIRAEDVGSGSLTVKLVVYGYTAFTAGRYPGAHGVISGTGLVAPSF